MLYSQVGKSACIVLAKERHSKGERVPFSACFQLVSKLKSEAASTLSLMFQIFLEKNYRTPWCTPGQFLHQICRSSLNIICFSMLVRCLDWVEWDTWPEISKTGQKIWRCQCIWFILAWWLRELWLVSLKLFSTEYLFNSVFAVAGVLCLGMLNEMYKNAAKKYDW